jgi:hypothetical protein
LLDTVDIWLRNRYDHSHRRCPFLVLSSRGRATGVAPDSLLAFWSRDWVAGFRRQTDRFTFGPFMLDPDTDTLLRNNVRRNDLPNQPTNKLLYDAIKDRGTAYLMVFRELKVRYGEDYAEDRNVTISASSMPTRTQSPEDMSHAGIALCLWAVRA